MVKVTSNLLPLLSLPLFIPMFLVLVASQIVTPLNHVTTNIARYSLVEEVVFPSPFLMDCSEMSFFFLVIREFQVAIWLVAFPVGRLVHPVKHSLARCARRAIRAREVEGRTTNS